MFSSVFSALSGMLGFSKGLDVVSNNVANMNTPGFKAAELQFRDLFYSYGQGGENVGQGLDTGSTRTIHRQGELRETSSPTDLAIDGNGFFVLQKDGETFYTRSGQFTFDDQGRLVDSASGARVAAFNGVGLTDISITGLRVQPPQATSEIRFADFLNLNASSSEAASHEITNVSIVDATGATRTLTIRFTRANQASLIGDSPLLSRTEPRTSFDLNSAVLSTTRQTTAEFPLISAALATTRTVARIGSETTYTVQAGDTFASIALEHYGSDEAAVATALADALGNPELTDGTVLALPDTVEHPVETPFYRVQSGDTWQTVAQAVYGTSADQAAEQLQTAFLAQGIIFPTDRTELTGFPASINVTADENVDPYYRVRTEDTSWEIVAERLYGSPLLVEEFAAALGIDVTSPPVAGAELTNLFPETLESETPIDITVTPYYTVREGDTWDSIARALYGSPFGAELEAQLGGVELTAGTRLPALPETLTISTENGTVNRWTFEVNEGTTTIGRGEVRYGGFSPLAGHETVAVDISATDLPGRIAFDFSDTTSGSGSSSTLRVAGHNGLTAGSLLETSFDEDGMLTLTYTNGQTTRQDRLAVALFQDLQALTLVGGNLFVAGPEQRPTIGTASTNGLGKIASKRVELSNVELTEQFTDIVILQRGFQASSQVISVANEMAQQLLDLRNRR